MQLLQLAADLLSTLVDVDEFSWSLELAYGGIDILSDMNGIVVDNSDELIDPYYLTIGEVQSSQMYANHHLLAK